MQESSVLRGLLSIAWLAAWLTIGSCASVPPSKPATTRDEVAARYTCLSGERYNWGLAKVSAFETLYKSNMEENSLFWNWGEIRRRPFDCVPPNAVLGYPGNWRSPGKQERIKLIRVDFAAVAAIPTTAEADFVEYSSGRFAAEWSSLFSSPGTAFGTQYFVHLNVPSGSVASKERPRVTPKISSLALGESDLAIVHAGTQAVPEGSVAILSQQKSMTQWSVSEDVYAQIPLSALEASAGTEFRLMAKWAGGECRLDVPPFYVAGFLQGQAHRTNALNWIMEKELQPVRRTVGTVGR